MKLSESAANVISNHINGLLVYATMVNNAREKRDFEKMNRAMQYFNGDADKLIDMGVPVIKYNLETK